MEYTVNQQNIQKYAERLTTDLCRQFFINKAFISGPEILKFNTDNQLNLLVVKNIYLNWQKETSRLKSIYFDYEDEEVKVALANFMNILSNHIKVYRSDFEVLLKKSIAEFILLAAAPQTFFTKECEILAGPKISLTLLKEFSKYIKVNKFVLDQVIREIEASGYTETFGGETIRFIMKALNENPAKIEPAEETLSGLFEQLPARVTEFVSVPKPPVTRPAFLDAPKEEVIYTPPPVLPVIIEEKVDSITVEDHSEPVLDESAESDGLKIEPKVESEIEGFGSEVVADFPEKIEESVLEVKEDEAKVEITEQVVFQKVENQTREIPVLEFPKAESEEPEPIVASSVSGPSVEVLGVKTTSVPFKTLVPMHYRFTFINALFGGNQQKWADAVDKIDASKSSEEAIALLRAEYAKEMNWDKEEDNVGILFNYVERKF
jgi:hypothetical protein